MINQVKIGKFIAEMRKQQNLTQRHWRNRLECLIKQYQNGKQDEVCQTMGFLWMFA